MFATTVNNDLKQFKDDHNALVKKTEQMIQYINSIETIKCHAT